MPCEVTAWRWIEKEIHAAPCLCYCLNTPSPTFYPIFKTYRLELRNSTLRFVFLTRAGKENNSPRVRIELTTVAFTVRNCYASRKIKESYIIIICQQKISVNIFNIMLSSILATGYNQFLFAFIDEQWNMSKRKALYKLYLRICYRRSV